MSKHIAQWLLQLKFNIIVVTLRAFEANPCLIYKHNCLLKKLGLYGKLAW